MTVFQHDLDITTHAPIEFVDITAPVREWVRGTGVREGLLTVISPHTTARVTLNERDAALQRDMVAFLEKVAPPAAPYEHNVDTVDDRPNAHAHLLGLFMAASESIPVSEGDLMLGAWQALFLVELDGPRPRREVLLNLIRVA